MWQTGWLRPAAMLLEEKLEPIFHPDSYGYRPGRSAHDALAVARKRCWSKDWVLDLDVRAFFDSVRHDLLMKRPAVTDSSTSTEMPPDQIRHSFRHPQGLVADSYGSDAVTAITL